MPKSLFLKFTLSDYNKDVYIKASDIVRIHPYGNFCRIINQEGTSMMISGTAEGVISQIEDALK